MKWHRIYALILKQYYLFKHNLDRKTEMFYWPVIDLILWGLTSLYFRQFAPDSLDVVLLIVTGILLWYFVWQAQNSVNTNVLVELWEHNLMNLFVSPLKFSEFIASAMVTSVIKAFVTFVSATVAAVLLYQLGLLPLGIWTIPFALLLMFTGWAYAFVVAGFLFRHGTTIQSVTWTVIWILNPFSGVYYPISTLPEWGQAVAALLPSSYIFESMRSLLQTGSFDVMNLVYCAILSVVYFVLAFLWLRHSFGKALVQGLAKLK